MRKLHFVLAANNSSSQTRVAAEYSNALVRRGYEVTVSVPRFDFYDFAAWKLKNGIFKRNDPLARMDRWMRWMGAAWVKSLVDRRPWEGQRHQLDPRVKVNRYGAVPDALNLPDADILLAFQCYLLPRLLGLPASKGRVVGSIRLDYQAGIDEPDPEISRWRVFCNDFYRKLKVPLFAVSRRSMESARAMGIAVDTVIPNGINTQEFKPAQRPPGKLKVTLFTQDHPQKGQDFGAQVIRRLREWKDRPEVIFCSAGGSPKPEHRELFDHHYGYLTGPAYVRMFQESDIFIYPSLYEGFPAVPLEAMACGSALASSWVSGVEEYALHEENCVTAQPGDVERLTQGVQSLIKDSRLRERVRESGIKTAAGYSWDAAAGKLVDFLERQVIGVKPYEYSRS